jgi:nucleotide-binding universal stress UspA family protein/ketosteroid isomerase-like protein
VLDARHVIGIAAAIGTEIRILHVLEALSEDAQLALLAFVQDETARDAALSQRLELTRRSLAERQDRFWSGLEPEARKIRDQVVATEVIEGFPAEAILREAARHGCDLIVLGAHEQALSRTFLSNIAKRVLRRATVPTLICPTARATEHTRPDRPEDTRRIVMTRTLTPQDLAATFDAFNRHDVNAVMTHFAEDCVFYTVAGPEVYGSKVEGAEAIAKAFSAVWEQIPDAHWDHHSHFVHGDRAVSEWTFSGTAADGTRIEAQGADLFTLRDGRIVVKQALRKQRLPAKA